MTYLLRNRLCTITIVLTLHAIVGITADEYGSFHNSHPPFQFVRSNFTCISENKQVLWDSILVEVHPGATEGCGITVQHSQAPDLWTAIDRCINDGLPELDAECWQDGEFGIVFQVNKTKLISNKNITFPCVEESDLPEIVAIHLIYTCRNGQTSGVHPDDDIMTLPPMLPPLPPNSGSGNTPLPPPPQPDPTMVIDHTDLNTPGNAHVVVTEEERTSSTKAIPTTTSVNTGLPSTISKGPAKPVNNERSEESESHPITYSELAIIVGPSVGAIALLIIILVVVIVCVKRKTLKLPGDLQGESLFYSRRFSTASQLSDISVTGQQMRTVP